MLKKGLIALLLSLVSVILTGIITLSVMDCIGYGDGDCGWLAVWLCGAFLPVLFFLPFIIAAQKKKDAIGDFTLFSMYSGGIGFIIISVILLIIVPRLCS
ncbi:hypothetical protein CRN76_02685 [Chryseobacterium indologenes]|uniref:hypothetical protein n=2 Tax=Chryseobacterium indologenes TaxID=253 RepID=UPI000BFBE6A0|nr:hypothetical protein [Chryseobacterium indologenes]ATN04390.1 hypothetical protein CRN76_02685 [Chryseobacterium indologenes]AYY86859.1 hypothetical protein EGX91_21075 [Chryseobacterium indologenes]QIX79845.1 hypothetical protein FOB56_00595 [Chryseobacterium indologenes]UDQ53478.1 hypothetical protein LJF28_18880 [Chryseobacterium indologenes]HAO29429.1 hypothetical protein [Chryseobacterium indologenes]